MSAGSSLHTSVNWRSIDPDDLHTRTEVCKLLRGHYVRDNSSCIVVSQRFLHWIWTAPAQPKNWLLGCFEHNRLIGVISAVPVHFRVNGERKPIAKINFLCLHKEHRGQGKGRLLVKELARRVMASGVVSAVYTGLGLQTFRHCVAQLSTIWRPLRPYKILDSGLMSIRPARYKLRDNVLNQSLRPMLVEDVPEVTDMLMQSTKHALYSPELSREEIAHWFLPRSGIVESFVAQHDGRIQELISFSLRGLEVYQSPHNICSAQCTVLLSSVRSIRLVMKDALVLARDAGADLFEALIVGQHGEEIAKTRLIRSSQNPLHYHLFNTQALPVASKNIGFVLPQ